MASSTSLAANLDVEPARTAEPARMDGLSEPSPGPIIGDPVWEDSEVPPDPGRHWTRWAEPAVLAALVLMAVATAWLVPGSGRRVLLSPASVALFLVANLLPAMALLVLAGRRIARRRAGTGGRPGGARLHTRLVALFSVTAAVPTVIVVVFASYLFQSGMDFWFSDRSRGMFENAVSVAQNFLENEKRDVGANALAMANDLRNELTRSSIESNQFYDFYVQQVVVRELGESAIIEVGPDGIARTAALIDPDNRAAETRLPPATLRRLVAGEQMVTGETGDGVEAAVRLIPGRSVFLYAARGSSLLGLDSVRRARTVSADYNALFSRSRALQLRFVLGLYLGSLLLVGGVIAVALLVADRIVRPIDELVGAANRVTRGDLEAWVRPPTGRPDEIAELSSAFNRMTSRLSAQTRDLVNANSQLDTRRAFIEAVLSAVASGVVSLDRDGHIQLVNAAAGAMLQRAPAALVGQPLHAVAPELARWIADDAGDPILAITIANEQRTWAARLVRDDHGAVLTFEDITQQLADQRRAAWSDVARRVAHEIKNPLTPIQLAADRLQRRFGPGLGEGQGRDTFNKLTSTIIRQVGDLRRMVDEFSSFARMPKPMFREDNLGDIVRQAMFLLEVSRPDMRFETRLPDDSVVIVCDRRLLAQAFTNVIKNAVEAVERTGRTDGLILAAVVPLSDRNVRIDITDNGAGLPSDRKSIVEPYVTTRAGGTGLGLAIVKKIVEEHQGELAFADGPGGGTVASIVLPAALPASNDTIDAAKG